LLILLIHFLVLFERNQELNQRLLIPLMQRYRSTKRWLIQFICLLSWKNRIASQGDTVEKARNNLAEASELFFRTCRLIRNQESIAQRNICDLDIQHATVRTDSIVV